MSLANINDTIEELTGTSGTLANNIVSLIQDVQGVYTAISEVGGTLPEDLNTENMADAINTIGS